MGQERVAMAPGQRLSNFGCNLCHAFGVGVVLHLDLDGTRAGSYDGFGVAHNDVLGAKSLVLSVGSAAPVGTWAAANNVLALPGHDGGHPSGDPRVHAAVVAVHGVPGHVENLVLAGAVVGLLDEVAVLEGHLGKKQEEKKKKGGSWSSRGVRTFVFCFSSQI
jgi:hypothetical protein